MAKSVLDAIQGGCWDYEPESRTDGEFPATRAIPGSDEKLRVLALRIQQGLPLWHPGDRHSYELPVVIDDVDPDAEAEQEFETQFSNAHQFAETTQLSETAQLTETEA